MRIAVVTAAAALALALMSGCSDDDGGDDGPASLDQGKVEQEVSDSLTEEVGQRPDDISCPDPLDAEEGATTRCTLTAAEDEVGVTVTVTSVDGDNYKLDIQVDDTISSPAS